MGRYLVHQKDGTQDALVAWLESRGCVYQHVGQPIDGWLWVPRTDGTGVTVAVDWKARYGKPRPAQERFWQRWPGPKYQLRTDVECAAMLAEVREGA